MKDTIFKLSPQSSYAGLSAQDLDSLGKRAAIQFMDHGTPLNDAVVKLAKSYPNISTHQVKRVVEAANNHTFTHIFEKQAGDKNIEFPIADPGAVLHALDMGARPSLQETCEDYSHEPVKESHVPVQQDLELMQIFGISPENTSSAIKTASTTPRVENVADRILRKLAYQPEIHPEATHRENMRAIERRVELEKKKQELVAMQSKAVDAQGDMGGAPEEPPMEGAPPPPMGDQGPPPEAGAPMGAEAVPPGGAPPAAPPPMPSHPPGLPGGAPYPMEQQKMGSALSKQAINYARAGRPHADLVLEDLRKASSINMLKEAIAKKGSAYSSANPYRELVESRQVLTRLAEDACCAADTNRDLHKEATLRFQSAVTDHMNNGGNMGEIVHAMNSIPTDHNQLKTAMSAAAMGLDKHGHRFPKLQAQVISYEMGKSASIRFVDKSHPIVSTYADLTKIAENQEILDRTYSNLKKQLIDVTSVIKEALANVSFAQ